MTDQEYAEATLKAQAAKSKGDIDAWLHWDRVRSDAQVERQKMRSAEKYPPVQFERLPDENLL